MQTVFYIAVAILVVAQLAPIWLFGYLMLCFFSCLIILGAMHEDHLTKRKSAVE